jgi:integrase/recombinase XerD
MLAHVRHSSHAARDRVIILLSVRAGLRAAEIAKLDWSMVLDVRGQVTDTITIRDAIAKKGSGRRIPVHNELRRALVALQRRFEGPGPVVRSSRGGAMQPNSIVNWFVQLFAELGIAGCSSHSGRRTFITTAARNAHRAGCSLRDVQLLAGHRSIETTQRYIDGDTDSQRKLVSLL